MKTKLQHINNFIDLIKPDLDLYIKEIPRTKFALLVFNKIDSTMSLLDSEEGDWDKLQKKDAVLLLTYNSNDNDSLEIEKIMTINRQILRNYSLKLIKFTYIKRPDYSLIGLTEIWDKFTESINYLAQTNKSKLKHYCDIVNKIENTTDIFKNKDANNSELDSILLKDFVSELDNLHLSNWCAKLLNSKHDGLKWDVEYHIYKLLNSNC
jgi:hypothetical protein